MVIRELPVRALPEPPQVTGRAQALTTANDRRPCHIRAGCARTGDPLRVKADGRRVSTAARASAGPIACRMISIATCGKGTLRDAEPADEAEVYSRLGLTLTCHPEDKRVVAEARPNSIMT